MEPYPNLNDPVVLRDHADREYRSRVEDLGAGLLVVARPRDLPADEVFGSGMEVSVAWADSEGGVTVLPTRILSAHDDGPRRLWSLAVTGPPSTQQRRRFDRAAAAGPVTLRPAGGDKTSAVTGSLVDVGEGGVRCTVRAGSADAFLAGHNQVVAEFRFGTVDFAIPGRVEFLRPTTRPAELEDLVVVFDEPVAEADALREQALAAQASTPKQDEGAE